MTQLHLFIFTLLVSITFVLSGPPFVCGQTGALEVDTLGCAPPSSDASAAFNFYCQYTCPTDLKQYAVPLEGFSYIPQCAPFVCNTNNNQNSLSANVNVASGCSCDALV
jgi:hypothetical protein